MACGMPQSMTDSFIENLLTRVRSSPLFGVERTDGYRFYGFTDARALLTNIKNSGRLRRPSPGIALPAPASENLE